jgi:hypothetical protein
MGLALLEDNPKEPIMLFLLACLPADAPSSSQEAVDPFQRLFLPTRADGLEALDSATDSEPVDSAPTEEPVDSGDSTEPVNTWLSDELYPSTTPASCPEFAPFDRVGTSIEYYQRYDKRNYYWTIRYTGNIGSEDFPVWEVAGSGYLTEANVDYLDQISIIQHYLCTEDGARLLSEDYHQTVTSHGYSNSDDVYTVWPARPLVMPKEVVVDTSWIVEGLTLPDKPFEPMQLDDSLREHIGRGYESKEIEAGTFSAFRQKMMLTEDTYDYYWSFPELGMLIFPAGAEVVEYSN